MTTIIQQRHNILKKDLDGHWYSIPEYLVNSFVQSVESIQNAEFMTDEWYEANDDFNNQFASYMKGEHVS